MKEIAKWNKAPVVRSVFYDDFSRGIRGDVWRALNEKWASQNNNGYSEDNCFCTTSPESVGAEGASGGLVVIRSNGDFAREEKRKRQGGGIVTKRLFGPGRYEVRCKVAPRAGQCSAAWTYYNDWAPAMKDRRYSEIDIEAPYGGDFRAYSGTTYENYLNGDEKISRSEVIATPPLNDGKWHVLGFEWRTDKGNGDEGIIWYQDGVPVLRIDEAVPHYTATFWVASLFQDAIAWLGDPLFETAYMYVDWVRISEYTDPAEPGCAEKESRLNFTGADISGLPVPHTEYIANGDFSRGASEKSFKGREIRSWELSGNAEISEGRLFLKDGGSASQTVTAQYAGYKFELSVEAEIPGRRAGAGLRAYAEYLSGKANCEAPRFSLVGRSGTEVFLESSGAAAAVFCIDAAQTEHLRVRIEVDERVGAAVKRVSLRLVG